MSSLRAETTASETARWQPKLKSQVWRRSFYTSVEKEFLCKELCSSLETCTSHPQLLTALGNLVIDILLSDQSQREHSVTEVLLSLLWQAYGRRKIMDTVGRLSECHIVIKKQMKRGPFDWSPPPSRSSSRSSSLATTLLDPTVILEQEARAQRRMVARSQSRYGPKCRRRQYVQNIERLRSLCPRNRTLPLKRTPQAYPQTAIVR